MEEIIMEQVPETAEAAPAERDYGSEVQALYAARPELRGQELPREVLQDCVRGEKLTEAYNRFARNRQQESETLRKENRLLRENARSAAKAPVRGVSHGSAVSNKPEDPFLRGFHAEW